MDLEKKYKYGSKDYLREKAILLLKEIKERGYDLEENKLNSDVVIPVEVFNELFNFLNNHNLD